MGPSPPPMAECVSGPDPSLPSDFMEEVVAASRSRVTWLYSPIVTIVLSAVATEFQKKVRRGAADFWEGLANVRPLTFEPPHLAVQRLS